ALRKRCDAKQPFVWLKRHALPQQAEAVAELDVPGVGQIEEARRYYPHGGTAAHVLGFVGVDSEGLGGLERRYDKLIRGATERVEVARDAHGRLFYRGAIGEAPLTGSRVELTLDANVQAVVERELAAGVANAHAKAGAAVVLDPRTGE